MKLKLFIIFLGILAFFLLPKISLAATYYVSPTGSDSNDGSIDFPWRTINCAKSKSGPGDTVNVRAGTYSEEVWIQGSLGEGGSSGNYWTLQAYPGEEAILQQRIIIDANYVRIKGFHMVGNNGYIEAVSWSGYSQYIEVLNNLMTGAYPLYQGAITASCSHCLIEGNTLTLTYTGSANDHGIYINAANNPTVTFTATDIIVRNNYVSGFSGYGIHIYDEQKNPSDPLRTISNITVENNFVIGSQLRSGILVAAGNLTKVQGVVIRNNVVVDNPEYDIVAMYSGSGINNIRIYNNTLFKFGSAGVYVGTGITNVLIKNNIIDKGGVGTYHIDNAGSSTTANNNLYWPSPASLHNITDSSAIVGDPKFVDASSNNFHLASDSSAIDQGLTLTDVPNDKDGVTRPQGSAYDIGAYEYVSETSDTTPPAPPTGVTVI